MTRGRSKRVGRGWSPPLAGRPLIQAQDHGAPVRIPASILNCTGDRWIEPFLEANHQNLLRLGIKAEVDAQRGISVKLTPGSRIGAIPLLSPSTRRVTSGFLVTPRFRWSALGAVMGDIGFTTEPSLGGTPLVPGSAREVPAWLLAAPVVRRLEGLLKHIKRGFVEREEERTSPRGRIDWHRWARAYVPAGRWHTMPCSFSEPDEDPGLLAAMRWTLSRLDDELAPFQEAEAAKLLHERVAALQQRIGHGEARRPTKFEGLVDSEWVSEALQGMGWIAEERGLGGSRVLDGLSWDLAIDEVWEAWVDSFIADLAPRCGLSAVRRGQTHRRINWSTPVSSMKALVPDSALRGRGRIVWVDAKYKAHLQLLTRGGWSSLDGSVRDAHRADLHQALAYASLGDETRVDSILAYPDFGVEYPHRPAVATVAVGRRRVRLLLAGLPFGFRSGTHRDRVLSEWREMLAV